MMDIDLTGKAVLIFLVLVVGAFLSFFAPSLTIVVLIFLVLSVIAYAIWVSGVRLNRRLTGRKAAAERKIVIDDE